MKRQTNQSILKSTGATVLAPGPRTFGAPEQKPSAAAPAASGVEDVSVRAASGKDAKPEGRERSGSISRTPGGPKAAGTESLPLSGLEDQRQGSSSVPQRRSQPVASALAPEPPAASAAASKRTSEAPARARGSKGSTELPGSSPSIVSESSRRPRKPSQELQAKDASLDDELEALLKGVEEPAPAASVAAGSSDPATAKGKEPKQEPKEVLAAAPAAGQEKEKCTVCGTQFQNGQSIYESTVAGQKQVLCRGCWSQVAPHCVACGKLISGPMAKVGDDVYHQECLKCAICSKVIDGALSKLDCGICCGGCTDEVDKDLRELRKLLQAGDLEGAALLEGSLKVRTAVTTQRMPPHAKDKRNSSIS